MQQQDMKDIVEVADVWAEHSLEPAIRGWKLVEYASSPANLRFYNESHRDHGERDLARLVKERERRERIIGEVTGEKF